MVNTEENILKSWIEEFGNWFLDEKRLEDAKMTSKLHPYTKLFSPIQINSIRLKNRIAMGPMGNISMPEEMGRPTPKMIKYFEARARGGAGLISSGLVMVSPGIDHTTTEKDGQSYFPRIDNSRTQLVGWRDISEACHAYGSRFFIQLSAGLGRVGSPECLLTKFKLPMSASTNPNFYLPSIPSLRARDKKLKKIIKRFGQCAINAKSQLVDGVYLHGHEGYLLEQLTNPAFNRRKFSKFSDWQTFGIEVVKEIRKICGKDYPIWYRIDLSLALNATYGKRMDEVKQFKKFKNERTIKQTLEYMKNLVEAGVDMFDVDLGCYDNWWLPHPPTNMPPGCFLPVSELVKKWFRENNIKSNKGLEVPILAVGKLGYPDLAEKALREEKCDMVVLARPLLADPEWPNKAYLGLCDQIRPCIGDQEACINEFIEGGHPQCSVNPCSGNEDLGCIIPSKVDKPKNIAIIGAGPGGVVCALTAAQRGHSVTLFDIHEKAGGILLAGSKPAAKIDLVNYMDYLNKMIDLCSKDHDLKLKFGTKADINILKNNKFDVVVMATGANPKKPKISGIDKKNVIQSIDFLNQPEKVKDAKNIVIVGGGVVGCEVAHMLAYEYKKNVTVIEMLPQFMHGACSANRFYILHYLEKAGVQLLNCTSVKEFLDTGVKVMKNVSDTVPMPYNTWNPIVPENIHNPFAKEIKEKLQEVDIPADLVILALGMEPNSTLFEEAIQNEVHAKMYCIGDAFEVGRIFEATKAGFRIGNSI